jgi:hypothetical protein
VSDRQAPYLVLISQNYVSPTHLLVSVDKNLYHLSLLASISELPLTEISCSGMVKRKGIHVALGPFIGPIGRVARGGRNWEGLGADPYLAGAGGALVTKGTQEAGVIATPKVSQLFQNIGAETYAKLALARTRTGVQAPPRFRG